MIRFDLISPIAFLFALLISSCSQATAPTAVSVTPTLSPTANTVPTAILSVAPTRVSMLADPTPSSAAAQPLSTLDMTAVVTSSAQPTGVATPIVVKPSGASRCHTAYEPSLNSLGLPANDALIAVPNNDTKDTQWSLINSDHGPRFITLQDVPASLRREALAAVSPDHDWLAFFTFDPADSRFDLWIASADGSSQRQVVTDLPVDFVVNWISSDTIVLSGGVPVPEHSPAPVPVLRINLATLETTRLDPINPLFDNGWALSPEGWQALSLEGWPASWVLYDFRTHTSEPITSPITTAVDTYPNNIAVQWTENGIDLLRQNSTGIDLFPREVVNQGNLSGGPGYSIVFSQTVEFVGFSGWLPDGDLIAIRTAKGLTLPAQSSLVVIDAPNAHYIDYCIPSEFVPDRVFVSPDHRYLAWQTFSDGKSGTFILDLATGRRARLLDFKVLAWVVLGR